MIKSYEQLVDKALELEELLIQRRIVHDKILELKEKTRNEDKNTNNPFIQNLQQDQKKELEISQNNEETILTKLKDKINSFYESVNQFIQSEYKKYAPLYGSKLKNMSEEKKKESYRYDMSSIDMKLKILHDIENYLKDDKKDYFRGREISEWDSRTFKEFTGGIYRNYVYSLKDITKNGEAEKKAEELFFDAIKYIAIKNQKEFAKKILDKLEPEYISTHMLAEHFPNTNLDVIVSLKNRLIDKEVLHPSGNTNLYSDILHSAHKDLKNNTTKHVELMPFFGVDYSKPGASHKGNGPDLIPVGGEVDSR